MLSFKIAQFKIQNVFIFAHETNWVILESGKQCLTIALRWSAAAIGRLCSAKNQLSAFCVRISVEGFFVQEKEPTEVCALLYLELQCLTRSLAPP